MSGYDDEPLFLPAEAPLKARILDALLTLCALILVAWPVIGVIYLIFIFTKWTLGVVF